MFVFGSSRDLAKTYLDSVSFDSHKPADDELLDLASAKMLLVKARMAYVAALQDDAPEDVLDALLRTHDEAFAAVGSMDSCLADAILQGTHHFLTGYGFEDRSKYAHLAGLRGSEVPDGPFGRRK